MISWYASAARSLNVWMKDLVKNVPVDVVIRPEDLYIFPVSDMRSCRRGRDFYFQIGCAL